MTKHVIPPEHAKWLEAPGASRKHTLGPMHRDLENAEISGCCQFLSLTDDINYNGGGVRIWPDTKTTVLNGKCPTRHLTKDLEPVDMLGNKGDVIVFDQRLLHRSLVNKTKNTTVKLTFSVHKTGLILDCA